MSPKRAPATEMKTTTLGLVLTAPTYLVVCLVTVAPIILAFLLSLTEANVTAGGVHWEFVGFSQYVKILTKGSFWESIRLTTFFTFVSLIIELVLGMAMALVLNEKFRGRALARSLILLPWALPTVVNARMWAWIYDGHGYGALNGLLQALGLADGDVVWLQNVVPFAGVPWLSHFLEWCGDSVALNMIIVADTWKVLPLVTLLLLAGLQTIPKEYYEAAKVDGAGPWSRFRHITYPHLKPVLLVILVLRTMELFRVFDILWIIMANTIKVLSIYTYEQGMVFGKLGRGAALSFLIGLIILLLSLVYIRLLRGEDE